MATWVVIIALSPVIVLVGEPVNRYVMRRLRGKLLPLADVVVVRAGQRSIRAAGAVRLTGLSSFLLTTISNPLWIALTAPGRWVADQFSKLAVPG